MRKPWILAVDLDGVLAKETTPDKYGVASPISENIRRVNELADRGHKIVIHTARGWFLYDLTYAWLVRHGVKFDRLVMGKLYAHYYIDDRGASLEEVSARLYEQQEDGRG